SCVLLRPRASLFPYTTLFRSAWPVRKRWAHRGGDAPVSARRQAGVTLVGTLIGLLLSMLGLAAMLVMYQATVSVSTEAARSAQRDRKSTRLNSSHVKISYAVF